MLRQFPSRFLAAFPFAFLFLVLGPFGALPTAEGQEIGFIEDYALSENREKVIQTLVPGTEDYYYFHCLNFLNSGRLDRVEAMLEPWRKRVGETGRYVSVRARMMLLGFETNPQRTLDFLERELNLKFDHQREIPQAKRNLKSQLDPKLIDPATLVQKAQRSRDLNSVTQYALSGVETDKLNRVERRRLLKRIGNPDFPNLVGLIAADLKERDSGGFGSLPVHNRLTLSQLEALGKLDQRLQSNNNFVNAILFHQRPNDDVNLRADKTAFAEYLERLEKVTRTLAPKFNSLRANVLYHQLRLAQKSGRYDEAKFREYLALPRRLAYVNKDIYKTAERSGELVNLGANYSNVVITRPIGNEEMLIRDYLQHFFRDAQSFTAYEPLLTTPFLKENFATAKILAGQGDAEQWVSMLSPSAYKNLVSRIDLEFAATNSEFFAPNQPVKLKLDIKNVDNLIVKIFEINTYNYYRKFKREVDTDISLDGLVPNFEKTFTYDTPPAIKKLHEFQFPEISKPGVYVVDFIGNGKSSRALLRVGKLSVIENRTMAGHAFRVIDHQRKPVKNYQLSLGDQRFTSDEQGMTVIPYTSTPGKTSVIVSREGFSCLDSFDHAAESYELKSSLVVDRESLLRNQKAFLIVRPQLQVSGVPTDVTLLKDVQVMIDSKTIDGSQASKTVKDIELGTGAETLVDFRVPPRLKSITFRLTANIENISQGKDQTLTVSRSYDVNQIDQTDEIKDIHLVPHQEGYSLEVLGKTGEPRARQAIALALATDQVAKPVRTTLQSDENGMVFLGQLKNVHRLTATAEGIKSRTWNLRTQNETHYGAVHRGVNDVLQFAAPYDLLQLQPTEVSLFEVRGGRAHRDRFKALSLENNRLMVQGLEPGNYVLRFHRSGKQVTIRVTDGVAMGKVLVGNSRRLEQRRFLPTTIDQISDAAETLKIRLKGANKWTRVHLIASRYAARFHEFDEFNRVRDVSPWWDQIPERKSSYMSGRKIGDEYQYILERRFASQFPGNMLDRPSLLASPWKVRDTNNLQEKLAKGDQFSADGIDAKRSKKAKAEKQSRSGSYADVSSLDFLAEGSVVLTNLSPNEEGVIEVKKELLKNHQHFRIVVNDAYTTMTRSINMKLKDRKFRDLRMASIMEPGKNFSKSRSVDVVKANNPFVIEDVVTAKFQKYDDLADVFRLFETQNRELSKFGFLMQWPKLERDEQERLYSEFACHELNFFLYHKDRKFFDEVVKKHVGFKRDNTFMDQWLLKQDLIDFIQPRQLQRLNTVERILLSQRLEDVKRELIRNIEEQYLLKPSNRQDFSRQFDLALDAVFMDDDEMREELSRVKGKLQALRKLKETKDISGNGVVGGLAFGTPGRGGGGGGGFGGRGNSRGRILAVAPQSNTAALGVSRKALPQLGRGVASDKLSLLQRQKTKLELKAMTEAESLANFAELDSDFAGRELSRERLRESRKGLQAFYRRVKKTSEYIESNYWKLRPEQESPNRVPVNRFWKNYANHEGGTFLSPYFTEANSSFTEMMMAMAVMDLPFEAEDPEVEFADSRMTMVAPNDMIILHQQVQPAVLDRGNTSVLVSENFFEKNDRYRTENGVRFDKFINEEFVVHALYGAQVVVTNPTSTPRMIDILTQLPAGAVLASGSQETQTIQKKLDAFSTQTYEYYFYFPAAGKFDHFPAHVSAEEKVLAVASPVAFLVTDKPRELDRTSWQYVSQNGEAADVVDFLNRNNVLGLNLEKIAFRMHDKEFFRRVISTLRNRLVFNRTLWSYSVKHNDAQALREFLDNEAKVAQWCRPKFESQLVKLDPVDRRWYYHREYQPLINARAHQVGKQRTILNPVFRQQYLMLMTTLAHQSRLSNDDHLVVTYYMLLQDRIEEAMAHFARVDSTQLNSQMQYDYCDAYLDMYRAKPEEAARKAEKWVSYPVDHWNQRFRNIIAQVEEIRGGATQVVNKKDTVQNQTMAASAAESFEFDVTERTVNIKYQNIDKLTVNYYQMDIELLFSRRPFAQDDLDGFSMIRPNQTSQIKLASKPGELMSHQFELPAALANKNVLIELVAGDQAKSKPYFANQLTVQMVEKLGQLKVMGLDGKSIPKAYVKVYHRTANGQVKFHKDGYTDLRGRFDYVSQSNNPLDGIQKYSILIMHPELGAVIRDANPPRE